MATAKKARKTVTPEEFILFSIQAVKGTEYTSKAGKVVKKLGAHVIYDGVNEAFRQLFPNVSPMDVTAKMAKENQIAIRPSRGGVTLYLPEDAPEVKENKADSLLSAFKAKR